MVGWIFIFAGLAAIGGAAFYVFRSVRRWKQEPPRTPAQVQAEMNLEAETSESQRY